MPKTLDLTGKWEFKEYPLSTRKSSDLDSTDWMQTNIPSSIFTSLIDADRIKQNQINTHPENFAWVSEKPWIFRKVFDVTDDMLNCDRLDLIFDGLDTITSIWLNDKLISRTANMFTPFRFDVTKLLKPKENSLLVKFEPSVQYAKKLMDRYTKFSEQDFTNPHRVYIRKAQYQFGWDFCPQLPGCGIWQPVRLEAIKKARIENLHIRTIDCNHHYADIKIAVKLDAVKKEKFICKLTLTNGKEKIEQDLTFDPGGDFHSTVIRVESPSLWWPAGYGQQNLYQLDVQLISCGEIIDWIKKDFGIRTLKLDRSKDEHGEKFQLVINGQPFFAKGANWIPASIFAGSVTSEDYKNLIGAAAESNINMLRVWGGGYYESDEFYNFCDQLGILIWQDFMFACAYYPDKQWFLAEVKNEATAIIKRLRNHPCLALWCGNNEIDWLNSIAALGRNKKFHGKAIYHRILPRLVAELAPDHHYIPTTPFSTTKNPNDPNSGTTHQWSVWFSHKPVREYLCPIETIPRFVTEFGLQSMPNKHTINSFCTPEQLRIGSQLIEKHNYQTDGNSRLYHYMGDLFGTAGDIDQFIYLTQVTQARAVKTYVEHLRAHSSKNNGVLFWQFNDCCPATTWSAVDYAKEPKALYYYVKRFFSKHLITTIPELQRARHGLASKLQSLSVIAINDSDKPLTAILKCQLVDLFGGLLDNVTFPITVGPFNKSTPFKLPKAIAFPQNPDTSCLHVLMEQDNKKIAENMFFYLPDKYIEWPKSQITRQLSQITGSCWKLTLNSNAITRDVQITTYTPAKFSDNFFDLLPLKDREIMIECRQKTSLHQLSLRLRSLTSVF